MSRAVTHNVLRLSFQSAAYGKRDFLSLQTAASFPGTNGGAERAPHSMPRRIMKHDKKISVHAAAPARLLAALLFLLFCLGTGAPSVHAALARKDAVQASDLYNPHPAAGAILLPIPCGLNMD